MHPDFWEGLQSKSLVNREKNRQSPKEKHVVFALENASNRKNGELPPRERSWKKAGWEGGDPLCGDSFLGKILKKKQPSYGPPT